MSAHKKIDLLCALVTAATVLAAILFCGGKAFGIETIPRALGYESRLFDPARVHTLDVEIDDWEGFLETCEREEYALCAVVIDGEAFRNVGIRGKGNTSLRSVASLGSSRYSFKLEFDRYDGAGSYHGLDKLCLNNLIQDNTFMKDYLSYTLMRRMGAAAPLCSFVYLTVNGEDWGLYLAVEGVEDAFLQRNYGSGSGELYKPDSTDLGGGRGNGGNFTFDGLLETDESSERSEKHVRPNAGERFTPSERSAPDGMSAPDGGFSPEETRGFGGKGSGGMGESDVKLQYIDDDPESYPNIFGNAKTDPSEADKSRLIRALKTLSENGSDPSAIADAVDTDAVIRYFAVHNFLCNGDSYTGSIVHNYYLYEEDGRLSMIPWDYNLAFGTFRGSDAASEVNSPIDSPVSGGMSDRPMLAWIFESEAYTALYHEALSALASETDFAALIAETAELIAPYAEKDPTKFCGYEDFEKGVSAIREFCLLRAESVLGQLDGSIPATSDGQRADGASLIDASSLTLSDMGTMENGNGFGNGKGGFGKRETAGSEPAFSPKSDAFPVPGSDGSSVPGADGAPPGTRESPENGNAAAGDFTPSDGAAFPEMNRGGRSETAPTGGTETERASLPLLLGSAVLLPLGIAVAVKAKPHN